MMPTDKHSSTANATTAGSGANGAALFATFYVSRERASSLHAQFMPLTQTTDVTHDGRQETVDKILMGRIDPAAAHDTTAIRLVLNASGNASVAWETMRQRLKNIIDALDSSTWWGYSIVYQAVLSEEVNSDTAFKKLLPTVRGLDSSKSLQRLAEAKVSEGWLWLVDIPRSDEGPAAASVYVALSPTDDERVFKEAVLGPRYMMLDLIAHKGYFLMRQYRGDVQRNYKSSLETLRSMSGDVLVDLAKQAKTFDKLEGIASNYSVLASIVSHLNDTKISAAQQLHNYEWWHAQMANNAIADYHSGHLQMINRELDLLVSRGEDRLRLANTAVSIAEAQLNKVQQSRQQQVGVLLAVVGAALAVPELVNQAAASAFLRWLVEKDGVGAILGWLPWEINPADMLEQFLIQLAAIVAATLIILLCARLARTLYRQ